MLVVTTRWSACVLVEQENCTDYYICVHADVVHVTVTTASFVYSPAICRLNEEAAALMQTAINEPHTPTPSELALIDSTTTQDINNLLHGSGSNISRKYTAKLPPLGEPLELDDAAYDTDLECESKYMCTFA